MDNSQIESILKGCEFFKKLDKSKIEKIAAHCHEESYDTGESVIQQGDFGENLYIIAEGRVFLERITDLGGRKGNVIIEALGKGRVFGCWSTLLDDPHILMSSAICQLPTRIVILKGSELREMMISDKELGFNILERLSFLLRDRIQAAYGALERI